MRKKTLLSLLMVSITAGLVAQTTTGLHILKLFHIGGTGGWDYL